MRNILRKRWQIPIKIILSLKLERDEVSEVKNINVSVNLLWSKNKN